MAVCVFCEGSLSVDEDFLCNSCSDCRAAITASTDGEALVVGSCYDGSVSRKVYWWIHEEPTADSTAHEFVAELRRKRNSNNE